MSTQENVQIVKDLFAAAGRGDNAVEMHIVSLRRQIVTIAGFDFWTGDSIHTENSRKYDAQSFTRLAVLGGWDVAELWTDADRLFAVFGLVAAGPPRRAANRWKASAPILR